MTGPGSPDFDRPSATRQWAIGCFMSFVGFFSGGMVAVLVSKAVAFFTKAPKCDGIPTCDWYIYMAVGGVFGAVTLPWLVVSALRSVPPVKVDSPDKKN